MVSQRSGTTLHSYSYSYDALSELTQVQQGSTTTSYTYDANGNRATMVTSAGTTTYTYDSADVELTSKTDSTGMVTNYTYDANGNLTTAVYDPGSSPHLNQTTTYTYDANNRLTGVTEPNGTSVTFSYDADGNRISKAVTSGGTTTTINDVYVLGHLDHQTNGAGNIIATYTYDTNGLPTSVVLSSGSRYFYVYNGHEDVVALTDNTGAVVASYSYDAFGVTTSTETIPNVPTGWSNPYRYDGAEGVQYDPETGLYWMSVRAYDPTLGRFISHDPLGRLAAWGLDLRPYVYANSNPINQTDPTGLVVINHALHDMDDGAVNPNGCLVGVVTPSCPIAQPPVTVPAYVNHNPGNCACNHDQNDSSDNDTSTVGNGASTSTQNPQKPKPDYNGLRSMAAQMADILDQASGWLTALAVISGGIAAMYTLNAAVAAGSAAGWSWTGIGLVLGSADAIWAAVQAGNYGALTFQEGVLASLTSKMAGIFHQEAGWSDDQWTTTNIAIDSTKMYGWIAAGTAQGLAFLSAAGPLGIAGWGGIAGGAVSLVASNLIGGGAMVVLFQESMIVSGH